MTVVITSIVLVFALFFSIQVVYNNFLAIGKLSRNNTIKPGAGVTMVRTELIACLLWGVFYYLTH
jgi:hypothetical protein